MTQLYTLVRHSAFSLGHQQFENAVEPRPIDSTAAKKVVKLGGYLFDNFAAAYQRSDDENGDIEPPKVPGAFVKKSFGDLYLPAA
jgi:hypothetical protein